MTEPQKIARINELSQLARTAWFSLLGYLVFVGITLLGVTDADFFVPSRQTDLPLVNVAIPTASFFWTAPILGAALYTYLHLFLIKLWDAHADARTADADPTHHWLVNDFVLIRQRDPVTRSRSLSWLIAPITVLLIWAAGPIVLSYAWWRSMPAHNEWLTLLIAACLWLTLVVGFTSWWRAAASLDRFPPRHWSTGAAIPMSGATALFLIALSWLRTEGGFEDYIDGAWTLDDVTFTIPSSTPVFRWWLSGDLTLPLARIDLHDVELVSLPSDWRSPETARAAFRETWCRREGLSMDVCDEPTGHDHDAAPAWLAADRLSWCSAHGKLAAEACTARFIDLDHRFAKDWGEERASERASLPALDLRDRDLRRADAPGVVLVGADLTSARLEGANLAFANMEGATLSQARMKGVNLMGTQLADGIFTFADLEGADLAFAQMRETNLMGADLRSSNWTGALISTSSALFADLRGAQLSQGQLDSMEGNPYTLLPDGLAPDTGIPYFVLSCSEADSTLRYSIIFECSTEARRKVGTTLPVDAPRPSGHPLDEPH